MQRQPQGSSGMNETTQRQLWSGSGMVERARSNLGVGLAWSSGSGVERGVQGNQDFRVHVLLRLVEVSDGLTPFGLTSRADVECRCDEPADERSRVDA